MRLLLFVVAYFGMMCFSANAQQPDDSLFQLKPGYLLTGEAVLYTGAMAGLNELWYKDYPRSRFHWFNDNNEWLQMDKIGHTYATYQTALQNARLINATGVPERRAALASTGLALLAISSIELFDGYSAQWGASAGDLAANTAGAAFYIGQECLWGRQKIRLKFGFSASPYAAKRPEVLGEHFGTQILKDYNGQSYWLSFNLHNIAGLNQVPPWIAIAVGYGADGMLHGEQNTGEYAHIERYRQFFISPDIDWQNIPTRRAGLKVLFRILNMIKVPLPALAYQKGDFKLYWMP